MSAIKTIRTQNIQSHKDVSIDLPETGLVVFSGDNSNGKSVIRKVLEDTIAYNINKVKVRKSLINEAASEGSLELIKYDGSALLVNINLEASRTWVRLRRADGTEVTRYLADKNIPELIREFGFHYNDNRDVSLNICDSDDSILFFRTNHVTNGDILNSALTDTGAQQKHEALSNVYSEAYSLRASYMENVRVATVAKDALVLYDIDRETKLLERVQTITAILSHIYIPDIWDLEPVPQVTYFDLPALKIDLCKMPVVIDLPPVRPWDLSGIATELVQIEEGVCPTCLRPFSSHQTCTSEM